MEPVLLEEAAANGSPTLAEVIQQMHWVAILVFPIPTLGKE
jgi:hypothetical protein